MANSPVLGIPLPAGTDYVSAGPTDFAAIINAIDASTTGPTVTRVKTGTLATFNSTYKANPGTYKLGFAFVCTDVAAAFVCDSTPAWRYFPLDGQATPIGSIQAYAGSTAPVDPDGTARWVLAQGQAISRTTYAAAFAVMGTTYGSGDGSTTFNVPNLQQRFPLGKAASGTGSTLGATGGSIDHTHSIPSMGLTATGTNPGVGVTGTIPSLSIQGWTLASLTTSTTVTVPNLTLVASAASHTHGLSAAYASIDPEPYFGNNLSIANLQRGSFAVTGFRQWSAPSMSSSFVTIGYSATGTALGGNTDGSGASVSGVAAGQTLSSQPGTTQSRTYNDGWTHTDTGVLGSGATGAITVNSTGTTSGGTTGTNNPPYQVVNYLVKIL